MRPIIHGFTEADPFQSLHSYNPVSRVSRTELENGRPDKSYDEAGHDAADCHEPLHVDRSRDWLTQLHRESHCRQLWCRSSRLEPRAQQRDLWENQAAYRYQQGIFEAARR